MSDQLCFNGIDATTGSYLLPPMQPEQLSAIIRGEPVDEALQKELKYWYERNTQGHYGIKEGLDPKNLSESGWGVIFPFDCDAAIIDALRPLLDLRKAQAGDLYKEYTGGEGYRPGDSKNTWLTRHGAGPGPADPANVPYYLLIVGSPDQIPSRFQSQLDVQYAVGRLCFDRVEEYANYAQSVVEAEKQQLRLPRKVGFFGVANPDDQATRLSSDQLIIPLVDTLQSYREPGLNNWQYELVAKAEAKKSRLGDFLGGKDTPALLFTGSHGMSFPNGDPRQIPQQGALLCQDWPGPRQWRQPIPQDFYFAADDLPSDAKLWGLISFFFACYGAGTPQLDAFAQQAFKDRAAIAPRSFIAGLPQKMLSHPKGGALAVLGHVERAWGYSFVWGSAGKQLAVFESTLRRLMEGHPIGSAFEYFNQRYAELSTVLSDELEEIQFGKKSDPYELSGMWTANNDARDYEILGDPAVRLMVADDGSAAAVARPSITLAEPPPPPSAAVQVKVTEIIAVPVQPAAPVIVAGGPANGGSTAPVDMAAESYGLLDSLTPVTAAMQQFGQKLGTFLSAAIDNAARLEIRTYTNSALTGQGDPLQGAELRAYTAIKIDGDIDQVIPLRDGGLDAELWEIHLSMVREAQSSRAELIKNAIAAASSLVNLGGLK